MKKDSWLFLRIGEYLNMMQSEEQKGLIKEAQRDGILGREQKSWVSPWRSLDTIPREQRVLLSVEVSGGKHPAFSYHVTIIGALVEVDGNGKR